MRVWVCETPFDESKPIQVHEEVEEALGIEEQIITQEEIPKPHKPSKVAKNKKVHK